LQTSILLRLEERRVSLAFGLAAMPPDRMQSIRGKRIKIPGKSLLFPLDFHRFPAPESRTRPSPTLQTEESHFSRANSHRQAESRGR